MADPTSSNADMESEAGEEVSLYDLLGVPKTATPDEIKKAYRKAALQHHPDKVAPERREESEAKFKAVTQAYEILRDEDKRQMYDMHGMAAFDPSRGGGMGAGMDLNDLLGQMFGMGMPGGGPGGGGPRRPRRGRDEQQEYKVTLEELYKGKTVKFAANKQVVCSQCKGSGAKDKVKPDTCEVCKGAGAVAALRQIGPGLVRKEVAPCDRCQGSGVYIKEKDRCKKCKGKRTTSETKALELYIPPGSMNGEHIILDGEADQFPDQIPGDIVFTLHEEPHERFTRDGPDLSADLVVTLAEALAGFDRVVLTHLDGRGLQMARQRGEVLKPNQILRVRGEGMPIKRSEERGDLYLIVKITFPEAGFLKSDEDYETLLKLLPKPAPAIKAEEVDEVEVEENVDIEEMGTKAGDPRFAGQWEDVDDDEGPQCATQ